MRNAKFQNSILKSFSGFSSIYVNDPFFVLLNNSIFHIPHGAHPIIHRDEEVTLVDFTATDFNEGCFDAVLVDNIVISSTHITDNIYKLTIELPTSELSSISTVSSINLQKL